MLILGDIAVPNRANASRLDSIFSAHSEVFSKKNLIINLEGVFTDNVKTTHNKPVLFNDSSVIPIFKKWGINTLGLANNHTLDLPQYWEFTKGKCNSSDFKIIGAGLSKEQASAPVNFNEAGKDVFVFNACWSVMLHHQSNPENGVYVNTINPKLLCSQVKSIRTANPNAAIIVYFHWNLDLETLPFPSDRKLSKKLIDLGANVIAGTHPHCVHGVEKYNNGYLVHSLGNFFVPWYTFINGHISFPEFSKVELAFEWDPISNDAKVHFFKYNPRNHELSLLESSSVEKSQLVKKYTPYAGYSDKRYLSYFKRHRRKNKLVPVFEEYDTPLITGIKNLILISRMKLARKLAQLKLRGWNN